MLPEWVYQHCPEMSAIHRDAAIARQAQLTKPTGALGRLEQLAIDLAGLQATEQPRASTVPIIIFAGDHGIVAQGVSAYPQGVTIAMMIRHAMDKGLKEIEVTQKAQDDWLDLLGRGRGTRARMTNMLSKCTPGYCIPSAELGHSETLS